MVTAGVLWNGDTAIAGSVHTVAHLKALGKRVVFVTNNSSKSRTKYEEKFAKLGFEDIQRQDITTSASATASYCRKNNLSKVFVVGEQGVLEECALQGISTTTIARDAPHACSMVEFNGLGEELEKDVSAVVVGWDTAFSFRKLCMATLYLHGGSRLIATNPDVSIKAPNGISMPGNGCALAAIQASAGKTAEVIGKPSRKLMLGLLETYGMKASETLMVGDRLDTDIAFAQSCNVDTLLVFTGCSTVQDLQNDSLPKPTYTGDSVCSAFGL